jgi:hypothetical protein
MLNDNASIEPPIRGIAATKPHRRESNIVVKASQIARSYYR